MLLVDELSKLYTEGVEMELERGLRTRVSALLLLFVADWPACGDCLGSMDHTGAQGCGMCKACVLSGKVELILREERTRREHEHGAKLYRDAKTQAERDKVYSQSGLRPCAFLRLPYFVASQVQVAEPMHVLLLGLCKDLLVQCKRANYLPKTIFPILEAKAKQLRVPREECARPVHKLGSNASGLKADQVRKVPMHTHMYSTPTQSVSRRAHAQCTHNAFSFIPCAFGRRRLVLA